MIFVYFQFYLFWNVSNLSRNVQLHRNSINSGFDVWHKAGFDMELGLTGKVALVTGASAGIGKAVAAELCREGCHVHMVSRSQDKLSAAAEELTAGDATKVSLHAMDLSLSHNVGKLVDAVGTPDILVNNAGAIPAGDLQTITESKWREAWDLKVFGYLNMTRAFMAKMTDRGSGVIVNVTGLAADRTDASYVAGTTGNAGLNAFSRAVGGRSLSDGVRVLAVSPGPVATERLVGLMRSRAESEFNDAESWQEYFKNLPDGRAATVQEIADVVVFMASERAGYVSGTVVTVDGGHGGNLASFA
ncbi:MAG: short-chain dehydrogenase/reductase [Alphaproteobacteria bacterium]|nr:short-chain dehydrogenase/reductase [Alphaproteobacteria bacterium]